jgi:hypothetical protein
MASSSAYGSVHRRAREHLLAVTPDGTPCPLCGQPMDLSAPRLLDAHHSGDRKALGLGADTLAHRKCNRAERAVPVQVRLKQRIAELEAAQAPAAERARRAGRAPERPTVPRGSGCPHPEQYLLEPPRRWGDEPAPRPCPYCGGYGSGRLWPLPEPEPEPVPEPAPDPFDSYAIGHIPEGELGRARAWGERLSAVTAAEAPPGRRQAS